MSENGRKLVSVKTHKSTNAFLFSSNYLNVVSDDSRHIGVILGLAKSHLLDEEYQGKLMAMLDDPLAARVLKYYRSNPKLDLSENMVSTLKLILDAELSNDAKFTYVVSALSLRFPLGEAELSRVFAARPNPLDEWESTAIEQPHYDVTHSAVEGALMVNYKPVRTLKKHTKSVEFYRALNLSLAFAFGDHNTSYGDFIRERGDDFFTPSLTPASYVADESLYAAVPRELLEDLYPSEFIRFMRYFALNVPNILLPWAKERLVSGVVSFHEMRDLGMILNKPLEPLDSNWSSVINYLSAEEIVEFSEILREHNGVSSLVRGAHPTLGAFLAYAFTRGGRARFRELIKHIVDSTAPEKEQYFGKPLLSPRWKNPYAKTAGNNPSLKPYVRAFENDDGSLPFDLLLMIQ